MKINTLNKCYKLFSCGRTRINFYSNSPISGWRIDKYLIVAENLEQSLNFYINKVFRKSNYDILNFTGNQEPEYTYYKVNFEAYENMMCYLVRIREVD